MSTRIPIAALVSDIHLSATPPIARSNEKNWLARQEDYLGQWADLKQRHLVPGIIAGDIFDKSREKESSALITMAWDYLKDDYAIPGQHDLPYHDYDAMEGSAFGVLVKGGCINLIEPNKPLHLKTESLVLHGFPWGFPITPLKGDKFGDDVMHLAVIHAYCWHKEHTYTGASRKQNAVAYKKQLKGYDAALFGDNHKGFLIKSGDTTILNNGGFMRRKADEVDSTPSMALLFSDGSIERVYVDCEEDVFINPHTLRDMIGEINGVDISGFVEELENAESNGLDFVEVLIKYLKDKKVTKQVKEILLDIVENK